jgi:protein disulfide-isomerase
MMQRAQWQDQVASNPDITAPQQQIRNQFVRVDQAPPIALEGYCPVSIYPPSPTQKGQWKKGDRRYGAVHRGRTYLFASPAEQGRFLADPDAFSPVLSGADPVLFAERGELIEGRRNFGIAYQNQMYFFTSEENLARFQAAPQQYSVNAHQAMMRSETGARLR